MKRAIFKNGNGQMYIVNLRNVAFYEVSVWSSDKICIKFAFVNGSKIVFLCESCESKVLSIENIDERFSQIIPFVRRVEGLEQ